MSQGKRMYDTSERDCSISYTWFPGRHYTVYSTDIYIWVSVRGRAVCVAFWQFRNWLTLPLLLLCPDNIPLNRNHTQSKYKISFVPVFGLTPFYLLICFILFHFSERISLQPASSLPIGRWVKLRCLREWGCDWPNHRLFSHFRQLCGRSLH